MPRYNYDEAEDFFEVIDTPKKATVLGLTCADGNIANNRNTVSIELKETDICYLEKLKEAIGLENIIYTRERDRSKVEGFSNNCINKYSTLSFCNEKMKQDLIKHGCGPCKSLTLKAPKNIPKHLIRYFILGYVDGDGSWYLYWRKRRKRYEPGFEIVGTKSLLEWIQLHLPVKSHIHQNNSNCLTLKVRKFADLIKLGDWLYKDFDKNFNLYMQRKKDKFEEIKKYIINKPNYVNGEILSANCIKVKHKKTGKIYPSIKKAAEAVDRNYNTIKGRLRDGSSKAQFEYVD